MFNRRRQVFRVRAWMPAAVIATAALMVAGSGVPVFALPARPYVFAPPASRVHAVTGVMAVKPDVRKLPNPAGRNFTPVAARWPAAASATVTVPARTGRTGVGAAVAGAGTPVWARPVPASRGGFREPTELGVTVLDQAAAHAAGVDGVLLTVSAAVSGATRIGVDYSGFAQAYGGNYGSRLRLESFPRCVLTTPSLPACRRGVALVSTNDGLNRQVSAQVTVPAGTASASGAGVRAPAGASLGDTGGNSPLLVLAVMTGSGSGDDGGSAGGTYAATTLKPEGSWTSGGSTGSFDYTYPIGTPTASTDLAPQVALSYDSGSIDGETSTTQAQAGWAGDGWSTPQSFIEQSFTSCADKPEGTASPTITSDECYDGPILTMSLNGSSTSLVWDKTAKVWKARDESGDVITHVTNGGDNGSGTYNHDYWKVTERDGTVYSFGLNHLPGWSSGKPATHSVDSEPVYSAHPSDGAAKEPTDPCYSSSGFTDSVCTMAYRWNLDYVTDVHGAAMAYYYQQDTNSYGEDNGTTTVSYVRDSHLDHIDYGFTDGHAYATIADKVVFASGDRCVTGTCDPLSSSTKANWPDVPYDLVCSSSCASNTAPSFFSTVRLTSIAAEQYSTALSAYVMVDSYALDQTIPAINGNATTPTLWLDSITHTGSDITAGGSTTPITLPPTTFTAVANPLPNRVDAVTDGLLAFYRNRIASITTESGAQIAVTYTVPQPCTAPVTQDPATNATSCFPVSWTPDGFSAPILDWFYKYAVSEVTVHDSTGGAPDEITSYSYTGAAWHYDNNELVKAKYRTYGQFRGYHDVKTFTGDGDNDPRTESEAVYYQGMSKDHGTTTVNVTDSQGGVHEDVDQLSGNTLETTTYQGENGPVDHSTITAYWVSDATATRSRTGLPALTANWTAPVETFTRQAVTTTGTLAWRDTETDTSYDESITSATVGLPEHTYTHTVPAQADYDSCGTTIYAPVNTGANIVGLAAEQENDSVACGGFTEGSSPTVPATVNTLAAPTTVSRPDQVISDTRTFYDDPALSTTFPQTAAPTLGEVTMVRKASGWGSGAFTYQTSAQSVYDSYGRPTAVTDGRGETTTTSYTTTGVGLTTAMSVTNALGQTSSTTLDPERGLVLTATDPNQVVTTEQYDALGRATAVWQDSRPTTGLANQKYTYLVQNDGGITAATTKTMNEEGGYATAVTLYDSQLRPRQTQTDTPQTGRMITDTFYDSRGWTTSTNNGWWDGDSTPNTTLVSAESLQDQVPNQDVYTYDGLGRAVVDTKERDGTPVTGEATTTVYNGDRTTVFPPTGGTVQTTITDPLGRTTELDQYTPTAPSLDTPTNTFTGYYTTTIAAGTTRAVLYGYDQHGNQDTVTQTSSGPQWTSTYNLLGQVVSKTDPDSGTSTMAYDPDGNLTQTTDSRNATISYTYDAINRKTGEYDSDIAAQQPGASGNQIAAWIYDNTNNYNGTGGISNAIGHLTTETAYSGGQEYTTQHTNFNVFGESLGEKISIPAATEGDELGITYSYTHIYSANTGEPAKDFYPNAGGLPAESVTHSYEVSGNTDLPSGIGGLNGYAGALLYDAYGRVTQETIGVGNNSAELTNTYDPHTSRLVDQVLTRHTATPTTADDEHYTYDPAGNITTQTDTRLNSSTTSETQCFTYDTLDQLTAAWTATDDCAATPTTADHTTVGDNLGTASAYWTTWTTPTGDSGFDTLGDRVEQIQHTLTTGQDTDTTYTYDGNDTNQPHTLTATDTTGGTTGSTSYTYDTTGNMTHRDTTQGNQTLTWNDADQLTAITGGTAGPTTFTYDADGNLLLQHDPDTTTLYLPGEQITLTGTVTTATRYYPLPGGGTAIRTGTATHYTFELTDQHDTPTLYLDHTAQTPTWRQYTPYGDPRGTTTTPPDNHGYLNKPTDTSTGLTTLGARQYDPTTGRFTSLDPLFEPTSPGQLNGYSYTTNNPITYSDPTGLMRMSEGGAPPCSNPTVCDHQRDQSNEAAAVGDSHEHHTFRSIGISTAVNIQESNTRYAAYLNAYNAAATTVARHNGWSDHEYDIMVWATVCEHNVRLCGAGPGSLTSAVAIELDGYTEFHDQNTAPVFDSVLVGEKLIAGKSQQIIGKLNFQVMAPEEGPGAAACLNSFAPNTRVLMADHSTKPIKDIRVGDNVEATDPTTDTTQTEPVTQLHDDHDTQLTDLTITTGNGHTSTIHTTTYHPFWDATTHQWTPAGHLTTGDHLTTTGTTTQATVAAIHNWTGAHDMRNLTVNQLHTYYVIAGNTPVLVHNTGCGADAWSPGDTLSNHFAEHGTDMGFQSEAEYREAAIDLTCSCDGLRTGVLQKTDSVTGKSYFYDPASKEFAITYPSGIDTYYTLDGGMDSFNGMPGDPVNY